MKTHVVLSIATCALLASLTSGGALAQDAAVANPTTVQVKLDNPSVRVLQSVLNPGQKEHVHSHPACVIYVISGGKVRSHMADGESVDSELVTGATIYREPITHWTENIGTSPIHLIVVELKDSKIDVVLGRLLPRGNVMHNTKQSNPSAPKNRFSGR